MILSCKSMYYVIYHGTIYNILEMQNARVVEIDFEAFTLTFLHHLVKLYIIKISGKIEARLGSGRSALLP